MIWDCFLYNGEKDILDIRMGELAQLGDIHHIAIEGTSTFQGEPKIVDVMLGGNFTHLIVDLDVAGCDCGCQDATRFSPNDAWVREAHQRNALVDYLDARPEDIVLLGDVDEVPRAMDIEVLSSKVLSNHALPVRFLMDSYVFCLDWYGGRDVPGTVMALKRQISTPAMMRHAVMEVTRGGWHFTYMGGVEVIERKLRSFSHVELNVPGVRDRLGDALYEGVVPWNGVKLTPLDGVGHLPKYVQQNIVKFQHLLRDKG